MLAARSTAAVRPAAISRTTRVVRASAVKPEHEERGLLAKMALPVAGMVAAAMISGAAMPEEALAAKSSGRVGGSSGFKSRSAPRAATSNTTVVNNTTVVAPPVYAAPMFSPFGGFGFGGFSIMPTFMVPIPFFGGLLQFFLLITLVSVIFNVVRSIGANSSSSSNKKDDGWGDL